MVIFNFPKSLNASIFTENLASNGVLVSAVSPNSIRAVMHFQISDIEAIRAANIIVDTANKLLS
jgi:hypothetical protein